MTVRLNRLGRPGIWAAANAVALAAASLWLATPDVRYLALALIATGAGAGVMIGDRSGRRGWRTASIAVLTFVVAGMLPIQGRLHAIDHRWESWWSGVEADAIAAIQRELDAALRETVTAAEAALVVSADSRRAFGALERLVRTRHESGVMLFEADSVLAWAGQVRHSTDATLPGIEAVVSPFYLSLRVTREEGVRRATAMALIDAAPPGDRIAESLSSRVARQSRFARFELTRPSIQEVPADGIRYVVDGVPLFDVRVAEAEQGTTRYAVLERARRSTGIGLALAIALFVIAVWRQWRQLPQRFAALGVALVCTATVPLSQYSNLSRAFNPAVYLAPTGHQFTGNAGALAITSAIALSGIILVVRRRRFRFGRMVGVAAVVAVAGAGPFLLRDLARGIRIPDTGVDSVLWLTWEIPLFLAAVSVLLTGAAAGATVLGPKRGAPPWLAPSLATIGAVLAPGVWEAPGRWPPWFVVLWIAVVGALALTRRTRHIVLAAATVAALGAVTLVWGRAARGRVELAEADLRSLNTVDPFVSELLARFAGMVSRVPAPASRQELLQLYVRSDLSPAAYPAKLYAWSAGDEPIDSLETAPFPLSRPEILAAVEDARAASAAAIREVAAWPGRVAILAAPAADGGITVVVVAPKSRLYPRHPFAQLYGIEAGPVHEPPYDLRLYAGGSGPIRPPGEFTWRRRGTELHGDGVAITGVGPRLVHVEVNLKDLPALIQRGALIVLLDLGIVSLLWAAGAIADGSAGRWLRARHRAWTSSYRARLTLAMSAFFVIPAAAFALWSYQQLGSEARSIQQVLVSQTLRAAEPVGEPAEWVPVESRRLHTPLILFVQGETRAASDAVLETLAPLGRFMARDVAVVLEPHEEGTANRFERVADARILVGYRPVITHTAFGSRGVLAAPSSSGGHHLDGRRRDLGILVLFTTAIGALAAFWLSGIAARQLARPIGSLRRAALSIAAGERVPGLEYEPTTEFRPVFAAFRRMAEDLNASRSALEEAQRRTSAVLRNAASGVVAVGSEGSIILANPRAEAIFGRTLAPGSIMVNMLPAEVANEILAFFASYADDGGFEIEWEGRQIRGQMTRLERGGVVATIDDVTELARAQRVLAWGEMARQVAHEIKNPLTPIRLGVQHLRRARADRRVDFDAVLDQNISRILTEIDRLDEIARSFSRYGSAPGERAPAEPTDVAAICRDVLALERMGEEETIAWEIRGADEPVMAMARSDELREVLLNLLENARLADASVVTLSLERDGESGAEGGTVVITVADNGRGIPASILPRIFEPHFSTRTSGSGLGLAISRQIVDEWGGGIAVESEAGQGTTVEVTLRPPPPSLP